MVRRHGRLARRLAGLLKRWRHKEPLYEQQEPQWHRIGANGQQERAILDLPFQHEGAER